MDHQYAVDTRCGFWMCSPDFMQPCAKVGFFTAFLSLVSLMTQTLVNYVNSQVTTLERQFGFNSHQTGIILAANDIGFLACVLFVGYLATRSHIPRSLGAAAIIYGLSGIACALPHFLFGAQVNADPAPESDNHTSSQLSQQMKLFGSVCDFNNSWTPCQNTSALKGDGRTNTVASASLAEKSLAIIVIGMALQGFGKGPRAAFSVTYLDGNTAKHNTGFYMGINVAVSVLGPAVAYLMGGVFSSMYVTLEDTKLTPRHPKWIGAWWLGYVVFGVLALVVAVPLFWFPRRLPRNKAKVTQPDDETIRKSGITDLTVTEPPLQKSATVDPQDQGRSLRKRLEFLWRHSREFLTSLCRLLTNPVFVCVVLSSSCTIFAVAGAGAFTPKYLESMFNLPTHQANFVMAVQTLCTSVVGSFLGGYLSRRLKMTAKIGVKFILISGGVGLVAHLLGFAFQCDQPTVHNWPSEENPCNSGCNCRDNSYFPICGGDGRTYYSPCHAGCPQVEQGVYQNCSCIIGGQATGGACDYGCSQLYVYAVAMGVRMLTGTLIIIPKIIVTIRCVSEQDKAMSMAVHTFVTSLLGWLLAPIVFGDVIDSSCQIWDVKCQTTGRCLRYDNNLFRVNLHGYGAAGSALAFIFVLITYIYARYTKCLDDVVKDEIVQVKTEIALIAKDDKGENGLPVVEPEPNNNTTKNGGNKTQAEDA